MSIKINRELEVKETTDTASSASFLDLYLEFDDSGQISTKIYDKRDDFNFKIINVLLKQYPPKETNMLSMRNSRILITCSSE
jgi:hypothetical protein